MRNTFFPCRNITWKRQNTVPRDSLLNLPSSKDLAHSVRPHYQGLGNPRRQGGGSVLFTNEGNDLMFGSHVFVFTSKTLYSLIFVFTNKIIESLLYIVFTNEIILVFVSTNDRDSFLLHYSSSIILCSYKCEMTSISIMFSKERCRRYEYTVYLNSKDGLPNFYK